MFKLSKKILNLIKFLSLIFLINFGINFFVQAELTEKVINETVNELISVGVLKDEEKEPLKDWLFKNKNNIKELEKFIVDIAQSAKYILRDFNIELKRRTRGTINNLINPIKSQVSAQFLYNVNYTLRHNFAEFYRN